MRVSMESLFELLLEVFLQIFGDVILDVVFRSKNPVVSMLRRGILVGLAATILAAISLAIHPAHLIKSHPLRVVALVGLPVVNGMAMQWVGRYFEKKGESRSAYEHALPAALFSLIFGFVRFYGAR